jgi:hypothetical protein
MDTAAQDLMAQLAADHDAVLPRILGSLPQFLARLEHDGASVYYDPDEGDCVLIAGEVAPSAVVELVDEYWLLVDPETDSVIGLEFPSLAAFLKAHPELTTMLTDLAAHAAQQPGTYVRLPPTQVAEMSPYLRAAVCA